MNEELTYDLSANATEEEENLPPPTPKKQRRKGQKRDIEEIYGDSEYPWDSGDYIVMLHRSNPRYFEQVPVGGHLETFGGPVSREEIQNRHGGGTFWVAIHGPSDTSSGKVRIETSLPFDIAGHPLTDHLPRSGKSKTSNGPAQDPQPPAAVMNKLVDTVLQSSERAVERSERERDRERAEPRRNVGPYSATLEIIKDALEKASLGKDDVIKQLQGELHQLRDGGGPQVGLLGTITQHSQANIQTLIQAHHAELRAKDEQQAREANTLREQMDRALREADARMREREEYYRREVEKTKEVALRERDEIVRAHERELRHADSTLRQAAELQKSTLEMRIAALDREVTVAQA